MLKVNEPYIYPAVSAFLGRYFIKPSIFIGWGNLLLANSGVEGWLVYIVYMGFFSFFCSTDLMMSSSVSQNRIDATGETHQR